MSGMETFFRCVGAASCGFPGSSCSPKPLVVAPFTFPMLAFVLVAWVSIFLGDAPTAEKLYDFSRMRFFLVYFAVFYSLTYFIPSRSPLTGGPLRLPWVKSLFVAVAVISVYGIVQHFIAIDLVRPGRQESPDVRDPDQKIGSSGAGDIQFITLLSRASTYSMRACLVRWDFGPSPDTFGFWGWGDCSSYCAHGHRAARAWVAIPICSACFRRLDAAVGSLQALRLRFFCLVGFFMRRIRVFASVCTALFLNRTIFTTLDLVSAFGTRRWQCSKITLCSGLDLITTSDMPRSMR